MIFFVFLLLDNKYIYSNMCINIGKPSINMKQLSWLWFITQFRKYYKAECCHGNGNLLFERVATYRFQSQRKENENSILSKSA